MPQKKNPDTLELVRGTAGDAVGGLTGLLTNLKGLPRAYNRDLQLAHSHAFRAVDAVINATDVAAGAVATATWNSEELTADAGDGFSTATGVADALAMTGMPFRTAHEIVAAAAEDIDDADDAATTAAKLDAAAEAVLGESLWSRVNRETVESVLDPAESVASRDSLGGPAASAVETQLDEAGARFDADAHSVSACREALAEADERLQAEVDSYV